MNHPLKRLGVIGAGAWGTALAAQSAAQGKAVILAAREADVAASINNTRENAFFLKGVPLPAGITAVTDNAAALDTQAVLLVTPSQFLRATLEPLRAIWPKGVPIVLCCKGIEQGSGMLMSEVATDVLGDKAPIAVLSGPTFAAEVARGLPTAVTVAMEDFAAAEALSEALAAPTFRTYAADDVIGAEVGGAVKNVLAIGCGIVEGHGLGDNARAALITRGVAEIARLSQDLGGRPETLLGLCGMGDITLTCNAMQSRNFSLGHALGRGRKLADVLAERVTVAEGVSTAASVSALADKRGIDMPIAKAVDAILHKNAGIEFCIQSLLNRPLKPEIIADPDIMAG